MFICKTKADLQNHLTKVNLPIGFVPTMGALHQGHLSLIKASMAKSLYTVCSIFVNPTQFNQATDLDNYPSNITQDVALLAESGCQVLFLPSVEEMYGHSVTSAAASFGTITDALEGLKRPGHFDGVITIVSKLFDAVLPQEVFFGQKDLQQCAVIKHLIALKYPFIHFNLMPTYREANGLAMSSRNLRLTPEQKETASNIYKALSHCKDAIVAGVLANQAIERAKTAFLNHPDLSCEYFELVDLYTMQPLKTITEHTAALVIACWCAEVRLIDNMLLSE